MNQYIGAECPVCHQRFTAEDDIVVCPECGTPHHRACWAQLGHCANEEMHGKDFNYEAPKGQAGTVCPSCGKPNSPEAIFCESCGAPLHGSEPQPAPGPAQAPPGMGMFFESNEDLSGEIDGIPVKDWATYIGPSAGYYLFQFRRMDATGHKFGACWSAVLFAPVYFMYRKVWGIGILAGILNLLLNAPTALLYLIEFGGLKTTVSAAWLSEISVPLSAAVLLVNLFWGIFAVWIYRKNAAKKLRKMREESASETEYQEKLAHAAGPSRGVLIAVSILFFLSALGQLFAL